MLLYIYIVAKRLINFTPLMQLKNKKENNMIKKKSFWTLVLSFCCIISAMFALTACGGHKHSFSDKWSYDAENHWHECTDKDCTEKSEYKTHDYSNDTDPTCDTCGYERTFAENNIVCENKISKTYNGKRQALVENIDFTTTYGTASVSYKLKDTENEFTTDAPKNSGNYLARIFVPATSAFKSASKIIEYTIERLDLNEVLKDINPYYNGTNTFQDYIFKGENNSLTSDSIQVEITFADKDVGTESSSARIFTNKSDKSVLNNYKFDESTFKIVRTKKTITLDSTMNRKLKIYDLDDGFSLINLDAYNFGIIEGETVSLQIEKTFDWPTGSVIKLVLDSKDYVNGENEIVKLSGVDAGNYNLYIYDKYPASATYTKN